MRRSAPGRLSAALVLLAALSFTVPPVTAAETGASDPRLRTSAPAARRIVTAAVAERAGHADPSPPNDRSGHTTFDPLAPVSSFSFEAIPRTGGNWPADPTGALSDTWYLTAVNTHYALYDLTGAPVLEPTSFAGLFELPAGTQVFDPKVVYDPYDDTFVLAFLGVNDAKRTSWILVVTIPDQTADDRSTWCGTRIGGDRTTGDGKQWVDYPGLGFSVDRVTVTSNQFNFSGGGFAFSQILSFPKTTDPEPGRLAGVHDPAGGVGGLDPALAVPRIARRGPARQPRRVAPHALAGGRWFEASRAPDRRPRVDRSVRDAVRRQPPALGHVVGPG